MLYTNGPALVLFVLLFVAWALAEVLGPVRWSRLRQGEKHDRGSFLLSVITGSCGVVCALLFPVLLPFLTLPWPVFFVGIALVIIGAAIRGTALRALGRSFTATLMIQQGQEVIRSGPYRLVRHPSYSGVLLIMVGFGLMLLNGASCLVLAGGLLIPLWYRIHVEEKVLQQTLPGYQEYMMSTPYRLLPFLF